MTQKKETKNEKDFSLSQEIKRIIKNITKKYGKSTITTLGKSKLKEQKILFTGSLLLNQAIGTGGYVCGPFGSLHEWFCTLIKKRKEILRDSWCARVYHT